MSFPYYLRIGSLRLHPHLIFETLAYFVAFRVYVWLRRERGDSLEDLNRWWVIAAAAVGAAIGSKVLYWFEDPELALAHWNDPMFLLGGKTIAGALIGGLIAVEWAKKRLGIVRRTGDLFALPLCVGIAIGRTRMLFNRDRRSHCRSGNDPAMGCEFRGRSNEASDPAV
jgi:phosphatidylglycerol:prolipoprotein diacylglycerol transferase